MPELIGDDQDLQARPAYRRNGFPGALYPVQPCWVEDVAVIDVQDAIAVQEDGLQGRKIRGAGHTLSSTARDAISPDRCLGLDTRCALEGLIFGGVLDDQRLR